MKMGIIYSKYYDKDIIFEETDTYNISNHPANYDNLATGIQPPEYAQRESAATCAHSLSWWWSWLSHTALSESRSGHPASAVYRALLRR